METILHNHQRYLFVNQFNKTPKFIMNLNLVMTMIDINNFKTNHFRTFLLK